MSYDFSSLRLAKSRHNNSVVDNCAMEWVYLLCNCHACHTLKVEGNVLSTDMPPCANTAIAYAVQAINDSSNDFEQVRVAAQLERIAKVGKRTHKDYEVTEFLRLWAIKKVLAKAEDLSDSQKAELATLSFYDLETEILELLDEVDSEDTPKSAINYWASLKTMFTSDDFLRAWVYEEHMERRPTDEILVELLDIVEKAAAEEGVLHELEAEFCAFAQTYASN